MNQNSTINGSEIPLGLGMAFAQNTEAMRCFSALPEEARQEVINRARSVHTKREMQALVEELGTRG